MRLSQLPLLPAPTPLLPNAATSDSRPKRPNRPLQPPTRFQSDNAPTVAFIDTSQLVAGNNPSLPGLVRGTTRLLLLHSGQ